MGKYSFVLKHEYESVLDVLTDEQAGKLFKLLFAYSKRGESDVGSDLSVKMAFAFLKGALDEANKKYEATCKKRAKAAKARWKKK